MDEQGAKADKDDVGESWVYEAYRDVKNTDFHVNMTTESFDLEPLKFCEPRELNCSKPRHTINSTLKFAGPISACVIKCSAHLSPNL